MGGQASGRRKSENQRARYGQRAEVKRSAREQGCSMKPQARRCCSAGCAEGARIPAGLWQMPEGVGGYAPGGANTDEDRRRAVFNPPVAPVLKLCFAVSAPVVQLARNRRCESCDELLLGLGPASKILTPFARCDQQEQDDTTERTNRDGRSPEPPSDMGETSAQRASRCTLRTTR